MTVRQTFVNPSQVKGWSHPAVQRLRHALEVTSDGEGHLLREVEEVILKGAWMTSFLPFPFTAESPEGQRLQAALNRAKTREQGSAILREFRFKFWNPVEAPADGVPFEVAFTNSLNLPKEREGLYDSRVRSKDWPNNWPH